MEPSHGAVTKLGGSAPTERWELRDGDDDIEGGWDGRWAPRRRGGQPWRGGAGARSQRDEHGRLDELI